MQYCCSVYSFIPTECLVQIGDAVSEQGVNTTSGFRQILSQKIAHLHACFILVYVGVEFTVGGLFIFRLI
jgi:fucose permease